LRVAFDLDDTLIARIHDFPLEPRGLLSRLCTREPIRAGTIALFRRLMADGHELWIYTSSYRDPRAVWWLFRVYGLTVQGVITAREHELVVLSNFETYPPCAKYPPAFGIDVLVDDAEGIAREGQQLGFPVIRLRPDDADWTSTVLAGVAELIRSRSQSRISGEQI
jgi:hypothetical protein